MNQKIGNALIAQGGGPTAVINSSLRGVVEALDRDLYESAHIWGARHGILGVFKDERVDLRVQSTSRWEEIAASPAAALGSCRKKLSDAEAEQAVRTLQKWEVRYFFYIGGNDSMDTALQMGRAARSVGYELHCAGIPKTIDNDLAETDHCPGFGSAARYYAQSTVDLGADIRSLPTPVSILEVMGRNAGWLTAATVMAREEEDDAPHLIYVPERPLSRDYFLDDVRRVYEARGWVVVAVSEGLKDENGDSLGIALGEASRDEFGHALVGDVGTSLARLVTSRLAIRARSEKPGLCARASALLVSQSDRTEAREIGAFGARQVLNGESEFMAAIRRNEDSSYRVEYRTVPLNQVANVERKLPESFVTPDGSNVEDTYRGYVAPLIGGPLRRHARL